MYLIEMKAYIHMNKINLDFLILSFIVFGTVFSKGSNSTSNNLTKISNKPRSLMVANGITYCLIIDYPREIVINRNYRMISAFYECSNGIGHQYNDKANGDIYITITDTCRCFEEMLCIRYSPEDPNYRSDYIGNLGSIEHITPSKFTKMQYIENGNYFSIFKVESMYTGYVTLSAYYIEDGLHGRCYNNKEEPRKFVARRDDLNFDIRWNSNPPSCSGDITLE